MPATHAVDRAAKVIRIVLTGSLDTVAMLDVIDRAAEAVAGPGFDILSDHRGLDVPATPEQVHAVVAHLGTHGAVFRGARWAIVVTRPASFGMMRMLASYAASIPLYVNIFSDVGEAEAWLGQRAADGAPPG